MNVSVPVGVGSFSILKAENQARYNTKLTKTREVIITRF